MFWGKIALAAAGLAALWWLWPRVNAPPVLPAVTLESDLDAMIARREAGIEADLRAHLDWDGAAGEVTPVSIVYLHGFSASPVEIAPVPQMIANRLGANLFVTRLTGHGQDGDALADATMGDWLRDTAEAVEIGAAIGERVVVIGTSTGATLAALAAQDPEYGTKIDGVVMLSGNFELQNKAAALLTWPLARYWVPLIAGRERCFETINAAHEAGWTSCYPTVAAIPMANLVQAAGEGDYSHATQPLLSIWSPEDQVINPVAVQDLMERWAGAVTPAPVELTEGSDPSSHVIAGDALSPAMNERVTQIMADWIAAN